MSEFLFPELEEDERQKREALHLSRLAAPPKDARGWQLRAIGDHKELSAGWNEPYPPKRNWVVLHYYRNRRSLCGNFFYTTNLPSKPHCQIEDPHAPSYRSICQDWLCKVCLILRNGEILPDDFMNTTRVVNLKWYVPYQIYIGRNNERYRLPASKWANPDKGARKKPPSVAMREYLEYVLSRPDLVAALPELKGKILACWCKDLDREVPCHGDVLAQLAEGDCQSPARLSFLEKGGR